MKTFTERDYILGVWYIPGPPPVDRDWFCMIWREGDAFAGEYRFRYYDPETYWLGPHEDHDRKSWYVLRGIPGEAEEIEHTMSEITTKISAFWGTQVDYVPVKGNGSALIEAMRTRSWAHGRVGPLDAT